MNDLETVAINSVPDAITTKVDLLYDQQKQDVANMRSALLDCNRTDAKSVQSAMRNILIMRIYHQIARIIKFTEQMDKIEAKMYRELDAQLADDSWVGMEALIPLITIQERLQKVMVESQKLLDPYMDIDMDMKQFMVVDVEAQAEDDDSFGAKILSQSSRQNIRESAQQILTLLENPSEKENLDE